MISNSVLPHTYYTNSSVVLMLKVNIECDLHVHEHVRIYTYILGAADRLGAFVFLAGFALHQAPLALAVRIVRGHIQLVRYRRSTIYFNSFILKKYGKYKSFF